MADEKETPKRSCYTCQHYGLCFLRHNIDAAMRTGLNMLNINGDGAPGTFQGIFDATANACMKYEYTPNQ